MGPMRITTSLSVPHGCWNIPRNQRGAGRVFAEGLQFLTDPVDPKTALTKHLVARGV